MRKVIFCLFISLSLILLTGCIKNYDRKDIKNYVKENLKITDIEVSKTCKEIKDILDNSGYRDKVWTVIDKENNITFHVVDDHYYSGESAGNRLISDYDASVFMKLYNEMDAKENVTYKCQTVNSFNKVNLYCKFTNKKELNECYNSLLYYKNYAESKNYNLEIPCALEYNFLLKTIGDYESNSGETYSELNNLDENVLNEAMYAYLSTALMFQIESGTSEITETDMNNILENGKTNLIFIKREDGSKEQYDDIIAHTYGYGISFGTLYKILEKEGFEPVGNPWHYTVTNKNGDNFEFSYDFNDYPYEESIGYNYKKITDGFYYIKNSEKISMPAFFYNCFDEDEIKEMFGIEIEEIAKRFLDN